MKIDPKKKYKARNGVLTKSITGDGLAFYVTYEDSFTCFVSISGEVAYLGWSYDLVEEVTALGTPVMDNFIPAQQQVKLPAGAYSGLYNHPTWDLEMQKEEQPQYFQGEFISGEEYEDRRGKKYRFIGLDENHLVFREMHPGFRIVLRHKNGQFHPVEAIEMQEDIIRHVPKPKPKVKRTVWLNVYERGMGPVGICTIFDTKEIADSMRTPYCIACIPVEIEYEEGEGL